MVDGAGRLKRIWHITLPGILPAIVTVLILSVGSFLGGGMMGGNFDQTMMLGNKLNASASEIIQTYAFKTGMVDLRFNYATAIGKKSRRTKEDWVFDIINYLLLILIALITLYPFYYILILSLNEGNDAVLGGIFLLPRMFTLENYKEFFSDSSWLNALWVTFLRTVGGTAIGVFFTCMVSYAFSRTDLLGQKIYIKVVVFAMYFSGGIIPFYILLKGLGLINTFQVYIVPGALNMFFVLVGISFFQSVPSELIESSYLDGASEFKTFLKIVLPVSMPLIATMTLFIAVNHWNSWIDSAYYVQNNDLRTLAYKMREVINQSMSPTTTDSTTLQYASNHSKTTTTSLQMAAMIVSVAPILCVYPFLQKYFTQGMMLGAVKG